MLGEREARLQELRMQNAMDQAIASRSNAELLDTLDSLVEDDWLGSVKPFDGSVYRALALGSMAWPRLTDICDSDLATTLTKGNAKWCGSLVVWIVQLVGPILMLGTVDTSTWAFGFGEWGRLPGNKMLGLLMVLLFDLHALYEIGREGESWQRCSILFNYLGCSSKQHVSLRMLNAGAVMNSYLLVTSCLVTFVLMGTAEGTQDVLFDALGICFLFQLDNIGEGSQLSFFTDQDWPGQQMAWMFERMNEKVDDPPEAGTYRHAYKIARWIILLLSFALPICWVCGDFGRGLEVANRLEVANNSTGT